MSESWQSQLEQWQQQIDALTLRERLLVFAMTLGLVLFAVQLVLLEPVLAENKKLHQQQQQLSKDLYQQQLEQQTLETILEVGVNRNKIRRRDELRNELQELDEQIQQSVQAMIPPQLMAEVLESILSHSTKLKLLSLENKPVVPLLLRDDSQSLDENGEPQLGQSDDEALDSEALASEVVDVRQGLFRHSFELRLQGSYPAVLAYLNTLTELPWQFYWDELHYEVQSYPNAVIRLQVHTVSMSKEWIGV